MINRDEMESPAAGYALSALDPEDQRLFEGHLATCPQCRQLVTEFKGVAGVLPIAVEEREPPASLRNRVLGSVVAEKRQEELTDGVPRIGLAGLWGLFQKKAAVSVSLVILIIGVVGLSIWNVSLQQRLESNETQLSRTFRAATIMAQADQWWRFEGTEAAPDAAGTLAYSSHDQEGYLMVWGLPIHEGHTYIAWTQLEGKRSRLGAMWSADGGLFRLIPGDTDKVNAIGVTRRPVKESPGETSVDVVILSLREP